LTKEAQWRPVFADMFRQGIKPRRRAGFLRHMLVERSASPMQALRKHSR
jgi:hypothetical protein